jgi:hypothetical protein
VVTEGKSRTTPAAAPVEGDVDKDPNGEARTRRIMEMIQKRKEEFAKRREMEAMGKAHKVRIGEYVAPEISELQKLAQIRREEAEALQKKRSRSPSPQRQRKK